METQVTEPNIATQEDFNEINGEIKQRELITPLRYRAAGIGTVVASGAFDRLRDAYLKVVLPTFVSVCSLCGGDVYDSEQFMRREMGGQFPMISHMVCEERLQGKKNCSDADLLAGKIRYQAAEITQLRNVILKVQQALGNFPSLLAEKIIEEANYATDKGQEQGRSISEHPYRGSGGQTPETSSSYRPVESGQVSAQVFAAEQASARALNQHPAFRVDDVLDAPDPPKNNYKWPPEFRQYFPNVTVQKMDVSCSTDPLGCADDRDSAKRDFGGLFKADHSSERRLYEAEIDNGLNDPPLYSLSYTGKAVQSCCE